MQIIDQFFAALSRWSKQEITEDEAIVGTGIGSLIMLAGLALKTGPLVAIGLIVTVSGVAAILSHRNDR